MSVKMNETHSYSTLVSGSDLFLEPLRTLSNPFSNPCGTPSIAPPAANYNGVMTPYGLATTRASQSETSRTLPRSVTSVAVPPWA
jgi:hypothetical protein